ncbi:MAG: InlB B-repeat-containing protein, partial [Clostridia bacterium]
LGVPTKTGYTFTGWTGSNVTTPQININIVKGSIGNKSYTANWKTINYTISYNLNGGNLATTNNYNIETNTFGLGVPTKTGYTFTGWTGSNGTTPQININIVKGYIGNKSYTANWNVNSYTVTYYNTSGGWYDSRTVNYGSSIPIVDYNAGDWNIFTGWTYSGIAIGNISMPSYNINVNANTREANCQIRTGQATNGDDSRISRFQELVGQKGLGGYWVYTEGLGNSFNSNWSNYSHVMEAANHLLANAGKSSWPYLRYLLLVSETGATRGLR